jgi:hypothetical protein
VTACDEDTVTAVEVLWGGHGHDAARLKPLLEGTIDGMPHPHELVGNTRFDGDAPT